MWFSKKAEFINQVLGPNQKITPGTKIPKQGSSGQCEVVNTELDLSSKKCCSRHATGLSHTKRKTSAWNEIFIFRSCDIPFWRDFSSILYIEFVIVHYIPIILLAWATVGRQWRGAFKVVASARKWEYGGPVTSHMHYIIIILSSCRYIIYIYRYIIYVYGIYHGNNTNNITQLPIPRACTSAFTRVRSAGGCTFFPPPPSLSGSGTQYDAITRFSVHTVATSYRR